MSRGPMGPPGGPPGGPPPKVRDFGGTIAKLLRYLNKHMAGIALVLTLAITATVLSVLTPRLMGSITDQLVNDYVSISVYNTVIAALPEGTPLPAGTRGADILEALPAQTRDGLTRTELATLSTLDLSARPQINFASIRSTMGKLLAMYILAALFSYFQGFIMTGISAKVTYRFRRDISQKINRLPLGYYDQMTYGEVLSRITNDVDTVSQTLSDSITQMITSLITVVGVLIMMMSISWQLTLVALAVLPLSLVLIRTVVGRTQRYFVGQQKTLGELNGLIEETFSGQSIIKVFGAGRRSIARFGEINEQMYGHAWKSQFFSGLMMPIMIFIGNLGYVGVCVVGGLLAAAGKSSVGSIQAFIQYLRLFNQPVAQLAQVANTLQSTAAAAERVFDFLEEKEESSDPSAPVQLHDVQGAVSFSHISFGYTPERTIIHDFTAEVEPGQVIAIVGPTGAGKTTMVNLLMRFYEIAEGSICIDGIDTKLMRRADVRHQFGMVLQDAWLFHGTIRDNILYAKPDATEEELQTTLRAAQVHHFISSLPGGLDMELNEDASNVSQGQKQLLTIARAMLASPPMLILDEATSSVDTRTEVLIQRAMANLMRGRTSFIIAHRLSTIRDADMILVMRDGNIIEQGTHEALLAQGGFYNELYQSQFVDSSAEVEV